MIEDNSIRSFRGKYYFLSNFYEYPFEYKGYMAATSEHHYQAAKASNELDYKRIIEAKTPAESKRIANSLEIPIKFHHNRVSIMMNILEHKFKIPELRELLLLTGEKELIEGNTWGDIFWGVDIHRGGHNFLGILLMRIRDNIRKEIENG